MKLRSIAGLMMLVSGACLAHGELPNAEWCEGGTIRVVATVHLSGAALLDPRNRCAPAGPGATSSARRKECGQFDDDYSIGSGVAALQCGVHAWPVTDSDVGTVLFIPEGPASYLADDHHARFHASEGLWGSCVRCESIPRIRPPRAAAQMEEQ